MRTYAEVVKGYRLNKDSTTVELGGYLGNWSLTLLGKHKPKSVHIFEPVPEFMKQCKTYFGHHPQVVFHECAVDEADGDKQLTVCADSSNLFGGGGTPITVKTISAQSFLALMPETVDLICINIEGSEYHLLEHLIATGDIKRFLDIWVQFHTNAPDYVARYQAIYDALLKTHDKDPAHTFQWENWVRKP